MTGTRFAVVVVNYGVSELIAENVAGLAGTGAEVVVVDNFSGSAERAGVTGAAAAHGWDLVVLPGNRGFGAGMNAGLARARALGCSAAVLLNPDVRARPEVVTALVEQVTAEPMTLVSPRIRRPDGSAWFTGAELLLSTGVTRRARGAPGDVAPWLPGTCLAVDLRLWDLVGGFDETYFLYWEDVDLSHRVVAAGGRLLVRDDLEVEHSVGGTQGEGKSAAYIRYNCRNRMLFAVRHLPSRSIARWLLHAPGYGRAVALRGGRRRLVRHPGLLLAAVRGSGEGAALAVGALVRPGALPRARRSEAGRT